jgi:hypothetical protein
MQLPSPLPTKLEIKGLGARLTPGPLSGVAREGERWLPSPPPTKLERGRVALFQNLHTSVYTTSGYNQLSSGAGCERTQRKPAGSAEIVMTAPYCQNAPMMLECGDVGLGDR